MHSPFFRCIGCLGIAFIAISSIGACSGDPAEITANGIHDAGGEAATTSLGTDSNGDSGAPAESGTDGAAPTCGLRGGARGLSSRGVTVAGANRTYLVYLPASVQSSKPTPFVFVFHGYLMSGQQMHDITDYAALADSEGIALVFPDGESGPNSLLAPWNVENPGQTVCGTGQLENATGDDFAFMDAIKADVSADQCLDTAHIFATGFSMGGYFSHHIGCYRSDVRAIAPHSGGTLASLTSCTTGHVPVLIFHGAADTTIAPGCDDPNSAAQSGFPPSATLWAQKNGCSNTYTTTPLTGSGGGQGQCYLYDNCPADGQVELCTFTGMAHCWAGGSTSGQGADVACPTYGNATQVEWAFFKKYAW
jgi:polyhydroxybutyrate depolymerase